MVSVLDSLEDFFLSLTGIGRKSSVAGRGVDPDLAAAMEELEQYLNTEDPAGRRTPGATGPRGTEHKNTEYTGADYGGGASAGAGYTGRTRTHSRFTGDNTKTPEFPPEYLRQHYKNLEVPFGAPFPEVSNRYRELIRRYHPDRFASAGPEKLETATEIIKRLNASYKSIKEYHQRRKP
jgi:DnaJ-domain-containing protein 1